MSNFDFSGRRYSLLVQGVGKGQTFHFGLTRFGSVA